MDPRANQNAAKCVAYEWGMFSDARRFVVHKRLYMAREEGEIYKDPHMMSLDMMDDEDLEEITSPFLVESAGYSYYRDDHKAALSAFLESYLTHARNLRDFFYAQKGKNDDILAQDFFDNPDDWINMRPSLGAYMASKRERLNRALSHISYSRVGYETTGKDWDMTAIYRDLLTTWNAFLRELPDDRREWFVGTESDSGRA